MPNGAFVVVMASLAAAVAGTAGAQVVAGSRAAGLDRCVEETGFMRKNHMEVLLHQRDRTMREGIRTREHSLVACVSCHASRGGDGQFRRIDARDQFCGSCHDRLAVTMDCFQCHAARPEDGARAAGWLPAVSHAQTGLGPTAGPGLD